MRQNGCCRQHLVVIQGITSLITCHHPRHILTERHWYFPTFLSWTDYHALLTALCQVSALPDVIITISVFVFSGLDNFSFWSICLQKVTHQLIHHPPAHSLILLSGSTLISPHFWIYFFSRVLVILFLLITSNSFPRPLPLSTFWPLGVDPHIRRHFLAFPTVQQISC